MKSPKILPWIARKAGISDQLALKLWRRAAGEAEFLTGSHEGPEYWGLAVERFLEHVEDEAGQLPQPALQSAPKLTWLWRHQSRMSLLGLLAAQNTYRLWQQNWQRYCLRQAA